MSLYRRSCNCYKFLLDLISSIKLLQNCYTFLLDFIKLVSFEAPQVNSMQRKSIKLIILMLNMNSQLVVVVLAVPVLQRNQLLCSKRLSYHYYYHYLFCINCVILFLGNAKRNKDQVWREEARCQDLQLLCWRK